MEGVKGRMTVWVQKRNSRQTLSAPRPVVEKGRKKVPFASGNGLRWSAGRFLLILVAVVLVLILVSDISVISSGSQSISKLHSRIDRLENSNTRIRNEINQSMDPAVINAVSVEQNLISSYGVTTISLTAPDNMR